MRGIDPGVPVYLWLGRTDMRLSFDRLSQLVREKLSRNALEGGLYVFFSRKRERVRIFYWDRDGYAIWQKRLEAGTFRVESREGQEEISGVDLEELLRGVDLSRIKLRKNAENGLYS
jgi:transposase